MLNKSATTNRRTLNPATFLAVILVLIAGLASPLAAIPSETDPKAAAVSIDTTIPQLSYDEALARASSENKFVAVYFWTDWCSNCAYFNANVLTDLKVIESMNRDFVFVPVDADRQKNLSTKFRVRSVPTTIFLNSSGQPVSILPGATPPEVFLVVLSYLSSKAYIDLEFEDYIQKYKPSAVAPTDDRTAAKQKSNSQPLLATLRTLTPSTVRFVSLGLIVAVQTFSPVFFSSVPYVIETNLTDSVLTSLNLWPKMLN
ncbi:MAG: thioredoxin family protein [Deltaproteobacteria bacterium]|nr:thioredoxin family protein [Deltaproteobacteria bacterium]